MSADNIGTELVFLKSGDVKPYAFFEEQLADTREMIVKEFEAMNATYEYEDFPPKPSPRECLSCRFAEVCPDSGMKITHH
jgi:CRISPR/Cas system-associated exonuclease Cas4 (RecB family)